MSKPNKHKNRKKSKNFNNLDNKRGRYQGGFSEEQKTASVTPDDPTMPDRAVDPQQDETTPSNLIILDALHELETNLRGEISLSRQEIIEKLQNELAKIKTEQQQLHQRLTDSEETQKVFDAILNLERVFLPQSQAIPQPQRPPSASSIPSQQPYQKREKNVLKPVDPNTGKNILEDQEGGTATRQTPPQSGSSTSDSSATTPVQCSEVGAQFAAQVAACLDTAAPRYPQQSPNMQPMPTQMHMQMAPQHVHLTHKPEGPVEGMTTVQSGSASMGGGEEGKSSSQQGRKEIKQKKSVSIQQDIKLHHAEQAWKPQMAASKTEEDPEKTKTSDLYRRVTSILNKLTPQKFQTLVNQMNELPIDTEDRLKGIVDLVFKKAVREPRFCIAYANMCKYLMMLKVPVQDKPGQTVNFRKLLISQCQQEFDKDNSQEIEYLKKMKEIEQAEESRRAQMREELEFEATKARRRSLGNCRFLGELFKLKMLTEKIMHHCVVKLLKSHDEESLECLCCLLTTIGKELDTDESKTQMNEYFKQLVLIVSGRKTSSRVRFIIQDLLEMRLSRWVPRRDENNPKTIDQIHKEVAKEAEAKAAYLKSLSNRGRRGVRDRDRGGRPQGMANVGEDGWNTVAVKAPRATIDPNRLRLSKQQNVDDNIPLGPSRNFSAWGRGTSAGGTKSQEGERPSTPGSRSHTMSGSTPPSRVHDPRSRDFRQEVKATPPANNLSEAEIEKKTKAIVDEFLNIHDTKKALSCIEELVTPSNLSRFVGALLSYVIERSKEARKQTATLLHDAVKKKIITVDLYISGLNQVLEFSEDMEIDIPQIWKYLGEFIEPMVYDGCVPLNFLKQACDCLKANKRAGILVSELLHELSNKMGHQKVTELWRSSGLVWTDFLPASDVQQFIKDKKLEFVLEDEPPKSPGLSAEHINMELEKLIITKDSDNEEVFDWIERNVEPEVTQSPRFIRSLMTIVCRSAITGQSFLKVDEDVIKKRDNLLQKYLDHNGERELQALYALQALAKKLEYPQGLLMSFFGVLYDESIISEDAFRQWERSKDPAEQDGKGAALKQVVQFLMFVKEENSGGEATADS